MSQGQTLSRTRGWFATWGRMSAIGIALVAQLVLYAWILLSLSEESP